MTETSELSLKYQRLAQEYAKLKAQNQVLKKAVLESQENTAKLQIHVQEKEQIIRRSHQEIDSSNFRSSQMAKRIELLQCELDQKEKKGKLFQDKGAPFQPGSTNVLDEDLRQKISENELLHKQLHDMDTSKRQLEQRLNDEVMTAKASAKQSDDALKNFRETHAEITEQLAVEKQQLQSELKSLQVESKQLHQETSLKVSDLEKENKDLESLAAQLSSTIEEVVIFNDHDVSEFNNLKLAPHNKRNKTYAQQLILDARELLTQFCKAFKNFHFYTKQRGTLFPVDSTLQPLSDAMVKLTQCSEDANPVLDLLLDAFDDAFCNTSSSQHHETGLLKPEKFANSFALYLSVLSKILPYQLTCLQDECESSVCVPALQAKSSDFLLSFKRLMPAMSKLSTYLSYVIGSTHSDAKEIENAKAAFQKIISALNELHLLFKDLSKAFNSKIALEKQLPTTASAPELHTANEFLLGSMLSLSNVAAKLCGLIQSNIDFISGCVLVNQNCVINKLALFKRNEEFLEKVSPCSPPPSVSYHEAIERKHLIESENREELLCQLKEVTGKLSSLEREKEHWLLETQLLQMKLDKVKSEDTLVPSARSRNESISLKPLETGMFGTVEVARPEEALEHANKTTEDLIKSHLTSRLSDAALKTQVAEGKAIHFENECRMLHKHLNLINSKKQALHSDVDSSSQRISQLQDELAVTRRNYEEQLSLMSEHLAAMNDKLAAQKDEIESLKTKMPKKSKALRLH